MRHSTPPAAYLLPFRITATTFPATCAGVVSSVCRRLPSPCNISLSSLRAIMRCKPPFRILCQYGNSSLQLLRNKTTQSNTVTTICQKRIHTVSPHRNSHRMSLLNQPCHLRQYHFIIKNLFHPLYTFSSKKRVSVEKRRPPH